MKTRKLAKGFYKVIDLTLGDQGWRVYFDSTLEGQLKWVVYNTDDELTEKMAEEGIDMLWATKSEALESIKDFTEIF